MRSYAHLILVVLVTSCSPEAAAQPARIPAPAPRPAGPVVGPTYEPPVGAIHIACTVRADIEATVSASRVRAKLVLRNLADTEATVTLEVPCPAGPVALLGMPEGFDPMHTCQRGACVAGSSTVTYKIAPRGTLKLGETVLAAKGDACNKPLPLGSTFLRAEVVTRPRQLEVCSGTPLHLVRDHKTKRLRRASLIAPMIPAVLPAKPPAKVPSKPVTPPPQKQTPAKPRNCHVCAFACTNGGVPSTRTDANGCPICGCDSPGL